MLIDVHCHLLSEKFDDPEDIIKDCEKGSIIVVNSTIHPDEVRMSLELSKRFKNVFTTIGLNASSVEQSLVEEVIRLIRRHRDEIAAIGEVGLDYHWVKDPDKRGDGRKNFQEFIELSNKLGMPLVVHSRDAEEDTISMLKRDRKPALLHCFSGSVEQAKEAIDLGCLISIPTSVVFSRKKQDIALKIPIQSIVLETDAPYLTPYKGRINTPENIKVCCEKVSRLKEMNFEEVMEITTKNALDFFNLKV